MPQRQSEPMSIETYTKLIQLVGLQKANEYRGRGFPKSVISYSLSYEASRGLRQIADQLGFTKGGTYPGSEVKANVSALLEAIGLGQVLVHVPTPEEYNDFFNNPEGNEYVLTLEHTE